MKRYLSKSRKPHLLFIIIVFGFLFNILAADTGEAALQYNLWYLIKSPLSVFPLDGLIGAFFVIVMALISAHFYKHKGQVYVGDKTEQIESPESFKIVYRYIQISTIIASLGAFLTNHPLFLQLHNNVVLLYIGISISTIAITLFVSAKLTLGDQYSPCFDSYVPRDIIQEGLYKYIRHPIYMSNIILLSGMVVATGSVWIIFNVVVLTGYYLRSAYKEEEVLSEKFPAYQEYMRTTNMILPGTKMFRSSVKNISSKQAH
jgi:protein-S-isoprenylcysteine O-methyltransferase Ste14